MEKLAKVRFVFNRKHTASAEKEAAVEIEVYFSRKRLFRNSGVKLLLGQWDEKLYVIDRPDAPILNRQLSSLMRRCMTAIAELSESPEGFSMRRFECWFDARTESASFIDYLITAINRRHDLRDTTKRQHEVMAEKLIEFGKIKYFDDLTQRNIIAFDRWLDNGERTQTTIYGYHKRLKIYINLAIQEQAWEGSNPYTYVKLKRGQSKQRAFLLEQELRELSLHDFGAIYINNVRDLFLFQCLTGMSYVELSHFDFERDVQEEDGKFIMRSRRTKTDVDFMVVLVPSAVAILARHDYKLPIISNTKYNLYLKAIDSAMNLNKGLTTHCGRHTFAVTALNRGIPIEVVAKILGHTDIKTTQIYAKIVQSSVVSAFDKLSDLL